MIIMVDILCD